MFANDLCEVNDGGRVSTQHKVAAGFVLRERIGFVCSLAIRECEYKPSRRARSHSLATD
jgi:hypothetical protein